MPPSASTVFGSPGKQTFTVPEYVQVMDLVVEGAGGGGGSNPDNFQSPGSGGDGGYIEREKYAVTPGDTFHPWPGEGGDGCGGTGSGGAGGTGWYDGGQGGSGNDCGDDCANGCGGGGGAASVLMDDADNPLLIGEGGGGGAGAREGSGQGAGPGGGGGGARGGLGGNTLGDAGEDAEGTGGGGDGGEYASEDGDPGGTDATIGYDTATTGGGRGGDGQITFQYADRVTDLSVAANNEDELELTWSLPSDVDSFDIHRAEASGSAEGDYTTVATGVSSSATSYTDTGLEDGEKYYYRIENVNSYDNRLSNEATNTTTLPAPSSVSVRETDQEEVTITWQNNDDSSDGDVVVERSSDGGSTWNGQATLSVGSTEHVDSVAEGTYQYRITRNTDHASATSGTVEVETYAAGSVMNTDDTTVRDADDSGTQLTQ